MAKQFTISLDFELFWGVHDSVPLENYRENLKGVWKAVPAILEVFNKNQVAATWATVGFLFATGYQELMDTRPEVDPAYTDSHLSPYRKFNQLKEMMQNEPDLFFAPSLIKEIMSEGKQEIGSHTHSHFYCLEKGQTVECFKRDMELFDKITQPYGIKAESIVFPRNQVNPEYFPILKEAGYTTFRGNEKFWPYKENEGDMYFGWKNRAGRFAETLLPLYSSVSNENILKDGLKKLSSTRFLAPVSGLPYVQTLRRKRISAQLKHHAQNNVPFHLWWHPHNFGVNLAANLQNLQEIIDEAIRLGYKFTSMSNTEL